MSFTFYQLLHVTAAFLYVAVVFSACATSKAGDRKLINLWMGITSLLVLVAGFGLLSKMGLGFDGWVIGKLVCWFGLSAVAGMAMRQPGKGGLLRIIAALLVGLVVYFVYRRPF